MIDDRTGSHADLVNLIEIAATSAAVQPAWSHQGTDLNVNLVVFEPGDGVDNHQNREVDVLLVGVLGVGVVTIDGVPHTLLPATAIVVSKGACRGTRAGEQRFAYLTCHRRPAGLWPTTEG